MKTPKKTMRKITLHLFLLTAIMLSIMVSVIISPPSIQADTDTFESSASDGFNNQVNWVAVYNTVRDAVANGDMDYSSTSIIVGQQYSVEGYAILRGYLFFDTSAIPDDAAISSATLRLYGESQNLQRSFGLQVLGGMPTYPHDPLINGDYERTQYSTTVLATKYCTPTTWSTAGYNNLLLNGNGLAVINKAGTTKFCLRSGFDLSGIAPIATFPDEYLSFYSANKEGTSYDPKLDITYTVPVTQVEVETDPADTIGETVARLRGQVTEDGDSLCTVWFEYGLTSSMLSATIHQESFVELSQFSESIAGLERGQLYYCRAMASNGETSGNGTTETFLTFPEEPDDDFAAASGDEEIILTWTKGDGAQMTMVRYLTTGSYPQSPTDGTQAYFDTGSGFTHTSLNNDTTYAYRAWSYATEGGLDEYSTDYASTFATPREDAIPTLSTEDAGDVTQSTAILYGYLSSMGGYSSVEVNFQWYEAGGNWTDHETAPDYRYAVGLFEAPLTGLDADTTYYFRARGENGAGNTTGASFSFTTGEISAPTMITEPATSETKTSATIHGEVADWGGASVTAWFEWGETNDPYEFTSSTASGLVTSSTLQLPLDDLEIDTTYHYRFVGRNTDGGVTRTGYGDDATFSTLAPDLPIVATQAAVAGASSATLNGYLISDGGADCEVRFQWYAEDGTAWGNVTGWQPNKESGDPFNHYITGLDIGKTYYFRAQARNIGDIANGNTESFLVEFTAPINFIATAISSYAVELAWTLGGDQTYIVMKPTGYSSNRSDGTLIHFGSSNTFLHMGLDPGETYYYRAWSWLTSGNFSDNYSDALATTLALGTGEQDLPAIIDAPDKPSRWDSTPDPTALNGTLLYSPINSVADAIGIPQSTFWLLLAVLCSVIVGLGVYRLSHTAVIAAFAMGLMLLGGWWMFIVPLWMIAIMGTMGIGVIYLERRL